jgi:putative Ca2+/H+ antiporter (TMEM165/GDT1 family)
MAYEAFRHGETNGRTSGCERRGIPAVVFGPLGLEPPMESFLVSISTVAVAEMGDRTQLLSLLLAAHYRKPWPILAGVLFATLANHALAAIIGARLGRFLTPTTLDAVIGVSMIAMALWTLKPDSLDEDSSKVTRANAFPATLVAFFVAEIGDKTQVATAALAAAYSNLFNVVAGTTAGMLLANAPVVFLGKTFSDRLPLKTVRYVASGLFLAIGVIFVCRAMQAAT